MSEQQSNPTVNTGLQNQPTTGVVRLSDGTSPAMTEIMSRSLVHLQTSKALGTRHRIRDQELCGPDYRLVCAWAEELGSPPDEVLEILLKESKVTGLGWNASLVGGQFKNLCVDCRTLNINGFPPIEGLMLDKLWFTRGRGNINLNLSAVSSLTELHCPENQLTCLNLYSVPNLTELNCSNNHLAALDLYAVPNLVSLFCSFNRLTNLDLSAVFRLSNLFCPNNQLSDLNLSAVRSLKSINCSKNQLKELDLSVVPDLMSLDCSDNYLTDLDLSLLLKGVMKVIKDFDRDSHLDVANMLATRPELEFLYCSNNHLVELDLSPVPNLKGLLYDENATRLIQRPDQDF